MSKTRTCRRWQFTGSIYRHGLRTGGRKHIHFATALPRDMPRSGMRSDSEVLLYLDVRAALADEVPVYLSQNRDVLTEGHGGTLPNRFISRVCVMVRGQEVEVESRAGALPSPQSVDEAWRHLGSRRSAPRRPRSSAASKSWLSALPLPASFASLWSFVLPLQSLSYSEAGMLSRKSTKAAFSARPLGVPSSLRPSLITLCLPYPGQWQVLHRSYARRVSRQQRRRQRPWTQFRCLAQLLCLSGSCLFRCLCSFLPGMHRPKGGPRQHYRPDGSRRRTAGELAKRAARAAERAAQAPDNPATAAPAGVVTDAAAKACPARASSSGSTAPPTTAPSGVPSSVPASSSASSAAPVTSGVLPSGYKMVGPLSKPDSGKGKKGVGRPDAAEKAGPEAAPAKEPGRGCDRLRILLDDLADLEVVRLLHLFQSTGGYTARHDEFHRLRDRLRDEGVHGPSGEPLPLPPVGNWVLGLGVCLLGIESEPGQELFASISNHAAGDLVETWSLSLWLQGPSRAPLAV